MARKNKIEGYLFGAVLALIVIGGGSMVLREMNRRQPVMPEKDVNNNKNRYDEGSLHHVAEELIHYDQIQKIPTAFKKVWSVYVDSQGRVLVSGDDGIRIYDSRGQQEQHIKSAKPIRFIIGKGEQLYAASGNEILIYDKSGQLQKRLSGSKEMQKIISIAFDDQHMFIAAKVDKISGAVFKCDLEGKVLKSFGRIADNVKDGLNIPGPWMDMQFYNGQLYVGNPGKHHVNVYSPDGELKNTIGHPSFKHQGFAGCCNPVAVAVLDGEQIITSEKGIARTKIISPIGILKSVVAAPVDFKERKHSFVVDVFVDSLKQIYLLENGTNQVFVYKRKANIPETQTAPAGTSKHEGSAKEGSKHEGSRHE